MYCLAQLASLACLCSIPYQLWPHSFGQGNTIHAQIYPAASQLFKQSVKEGNVYNFYYFRVKNSENYKPVANDHMLCFSKWTKIEEVVDIPPAFPMYTYSIASMEQLQERVDSRALFTGK